ncbi:DUF3857 domain-containing transglutaminase family protein [Flagellimonas marina]|uniref:DUF3857 domain-containing transglutaminase family protein n=1 Tax=Flagellimonas marina TaxID=1775168 RepID=A0ABV8PQ20_9FLAO
MQEKYDVNSGIPENGVADGSQVLLYTEQVNVDLEEVYFKSVGKAVDFNGIQSISSVSADYDPSYQQLRFHNVDVVRNGKTINRLRLEDIQTARRERNSENFIYDGTITAFMNIPDVRTGDITVFSYSIKGFNPIQKNKFSTSFVLSSPKYLDRISAHIFSTRKLNFKIINSDVSTSENTRKGITHYSWAQEKVPAIKMDENIPFWFIQNATVFVSEYEAWNDVIAWGEKLFTFNEPYSKELIAIADDIMAKHPSEGGRITAALKFVQNEIRYLALHSGIGGYQPNSPNKVVEQRFGDCKDKSVLFAALLHKMGIEAYPTLVNTRLAHVLSTMMPSSKVFDHCIVKVIDKEGTNLWYDPTLVNQGGSFNDIFIPDYQFGLVLDPRLNYLDTISNFQNNMVEKFSTFKIVEIGKGADLEIRSHYHDGEADYMRSILKNNSKDIIDKELLSVATHNYGRLASKAPFTVVDDSLKNEIVVLEQYKLDSIWDKSMENPNSVNLTIIPFNLTSALSMPTQLDRSTPYALSYPMVRKHHFELKLPERILARPEEFTINSDFFYYNYNSTYDISSNTLNISYYYKNQSDHVPASAFNTFYDEMVKLDKNIGYMISTNTNKGWDNANSSYSIGSLFLFGSVVFVIIALLIIAAIVFINRKASKKSVE